ncbi:MAG: MOSC domain-containing protein [Archangium sp.]
MKLLRAFIYPVKSLRGIEVSSLQLDALGPAGDRRWMVVDEKNRFVTQRSVPAMATVQPTISAGELKLQRDGASVLIHEPPLDGPRLTVTVWKDTFEALDAGDDAAEWLSDQLKTTVRLVHFAPDVRRDVDPKYAPHAQTSFSDGYPLLITNEASLDALNSQLPSAIPMERFRPNLVVRAEQPWAEDRWSRLIIDGVTFDGVKTCARCVMINTDQRTGEKPDGNVPLERLTEVHGVEGRGAIFGMNLVHRGTGTVRVGSEVTSPAAREARTQGENAVTTSHV